jgi:futalosine hydrolase
MKILIVAATELEIKKIVGNFDLINNTAPNLNRYNFLHHEIDVLVTGIGMVATAFELGKVLAKNDYDFAIDCGIAGSFDNNILIGETVHVDNELFAEFFAENGDELIPVLNLEMIDDICPFSNKKGELINRSIIKNSVINSMRKARGITLNKISGSEETIEFLRKSFNPQVETMEGAAFYYCCFSSGVNCAEIRTISNFVEPRSLAKWEIEKAVQALTGKVIAILNAFNCGCNG